MCCCLPLLLTEPVTMAQEMSLFHFHFHFMQGQQEDDAVCLIMILRVAGKADFRAKLSLPPQTKPLTSWLQP